MSLLSILGIIALVVLGILAAVVGFFAVLLGGGHSNPFQ